MADVGRCCRRLLNLCFSNTAVLSFGRRLRPASYSYSFNRTATRTGRIYTFGRLSTHLLGVQNMPVWSLIKKMRCLQLTVYGSFLNKATSWFSKPASELFSDMNGSITWSPANKMSLLKMKEVELLTSAFSAPRWQILFAVCQSLHCGLCMAFYGQPRGMVKAFVLPD